MSIEAKNIREDIARSRAAAAKNDLLRCLEFLRDAVHGLITVQVYGRERFEIEALLVEALKDLNGLKTMQKVMPKGLAYRKGKEKQLFVTLKRLHTKLKQAMEAAKVRRQRQRLAQLDIMLGKAGDFLKKKEEVEARKLFRKVADGFPEIPGLLSDIGTRMAMGGLVAEAVEYLKRALDADNRDHRAHQSLVMCFEGMGELAKAEDAVNNAMKYLGPSEVWYLKLANLAVSQSKWDVAMDAVERVLKNNPLSREASKIAKKVSPKVYTGGKPGSAAVKKANKAGNKPKKEIKLDF